MASMAPDAHSPDSFATTHWSLVLAVGRKSQPDADRALAALCQTYWYPLYAYARRQTADVHDAQDVIQSFFARLLEKDLLAVAHPERGRFRSFLLTALKHFLLNEWAKDGAQKRGGGRVALSLDFDSGESRYHLEPAHDLAADKLYERQWALTLLDRVLGLLRTEYSAAGKEALFLRLKDFIGAARGEAWYREAAGDLGITEGAARVAAHRLRQRYREILRAELAQTVADPAELDDEIRHLFAALGK
jgi:RNA polymerase sigma-70 factor (ECF subfamily)